MNKKELMRYIRGIRDLAYGYGIAQALYIAASILALYGALVLGAAING